ncbi:unnamed protein product [Sphenostylis stenocarpa]|uniref:Uncharacterized protein n=1 Tax=Sphenostylis stenocarpa TaxID=92480 RepID=A0AA86SGN5_9FABA|nr:unnamed protein product [Sphenostylis stenocarpa]
MECDVLVVNVSDEALWYWVSLSEIKGLDSRFENDCPGNVVMVMMKTKSYSLGPDLDFCPSQSFIFYLLIHQKRNG